MEVAGQWRREWAGTAEYGKVIEGGVTRHVARAMEVLHASAPGARVRVMRAAYHSAGPGLPAASVLMHSSRRVISSGYNLLESPTKPLEISSLPLDSPSEYNIDTENYKVTEPDDSEISEPSKWRASTGANIRMPSEESSSTDNTSVIDVDSRFSTVTFRKQSYDSENSDSSMTRKYASRLSPLLDSSVALSTLKYKSLLNGSNDWTNRRKSYSFEDTSPLNENIHTNDALAMESSTDSGICKSSEIVNEPDDKNTNQDVNTSFSNHEETFRDWLVKNRPCASFNIHGIQKPPKTEHKVVMEEHTENTIALQSKGKVTITVPITLETDEEYQQRKNLSSEDGDRKTKKVEFCKTELHFAPDTGKVNVIATDEKPPPSTNFRKRRSVFVPIGGNFEKPVTLFGVPSKEFDMEGGKCTYTIYNDTSESDENTAATKSILKNKIPKPKPYLLGENMDFGYNGDVKITGDSCFGSVVPTAVSLMNKQLQERRSSNEISANVTDTGFTKDCLSRTTTIGPHGISAFANKDSNTTSLRDKFQTWQFSPVPVRARTRQLRDSDLTYFGVSKSTNKIQTSATNKPSTHCTRLNSDKCCNDSTFQSVILVQKISSSVCSNETDSEEPPEYQNIPIKSTFGPIPTPRTRTKYDRNSTDNNEVLVSKPGKQPGNEIGFHSVESRRSRLRRLVGDTTTSSNRSISAPPKTSLYNPTEDARMQNKRSQVLVKVSPTPRSKKSHEIVSHNSEIVKTLSDSTNNLTILETHEPLYVNLNAEEAKTKHYLQTTNSSRRKIENSTKGSSEKPADARESRTYDRRDNRGKFKSTTRAETEIFKQNLEKERSPKRTKVKRTEKLSTPEYPKDTIRNSSRTRRRSSIERSDGLNNSYKSLQENRSRSSQMRPVNVGSDQLIKFGTKGVDQKDTKYKPVIEENNKDTKYSRSNSLKNRNGRKKVTSKTEQKPDIKSESIHHEERAIADKASTKPDSRASTRTEYVINYDDKNGTIASICKLPSTSPKNKKSEPGRAKTSSKENKAKYKTSEKIALRNAVPRAPMGSKRDLRR